jgi:type VI secretion system protein ImpF
VINRNESIRASVLDRLIDMEPELSGEPVQYRLITFTQVRAAVIRDIENLLNAKNFYSDLPAAFPQINKSVLVYGLTDYTSMSPRNQSVRLKLRQEIERVISVFEPRLRDVSVRIDDSGGNERNLRFKINGVLVVEPLKEPITFDTLFDINRCEYSIFK